MYTVTLDCLQPKDSLQRPIPFSCCDGNTFPILPSGTLAIITTYQFKCCGQIVSWNTYVQPDGNEDVGGHYTVDFQVWRPSSMVETNGCYSMLGYDRYSGILGDRGLVTKVTKPSQRISFRTGDVVGMLIVRSYNINNSGPKKGGIKLDTTYSEEKVWYHVISKVDRLVPGEKSCPLSVGPGRQLGNSINAAPLLSLQTGKKIVVHRTLYLYSWEQCCKME